MWEKIIIGASGKMVDANTQFVGNRALAEMRRWWNMLPTWSKRIALVNLRICKHHSNFLILSWKVLQPLLIQNLSTVYFKESNLNKKTNYRFGCSFNPHCQAHNLNAVCNRCRQIEKKILDEILGKTVYDSRIRCDNKVSSI